MIHITMQFENMDALHNFTAQLAKPIGAAKVLGGVGIVHVAPPVEVEFAVEAPMAEQLELNTPPAEAQAPKGKPGRTKKNPETVATVSNTPAKPVTLDDVRGVLMTFNTKFGLQALGAKLKAEFNTGGIKGLKPEQYAAVMESFSVGK